MAQERESYTRIGTRQVTREEAWQITCHEAGHAVAAVRLDTPFTHVERGEGEHAEVHPGNNPVNTPETMWTGGEVSRWQQFYAAGTAAEIVLFGDYRSYGSRKDRSLHELLEMRWRPSRSNGWKQDIQSVIEILDGGAVVRVAKQLDERRTLSEEEVYQLLGRIPPWCHS